MTNNDEVLYALHSTGKWTLFELARNYTMTPQAVAEALQRVGTAKVLQHSLSVIEHHVEHQRTMCN